MRVPAGIADKGVPVRLRQRMGHAKLSRKEISGALGPVRMENSECDLNI